MFWILTFAAVLAVLAVVIRRGPDLAADFERMLKQEGEFDALRPHPLVTEDSIAALPAPVQRYVRLSGAIGKPRVASILVTYDAEMFSKPGAAPMKGVARQYDRFDPPKRLFFLPTRMMGLPVRVLHDYEGSAATMKVRLAGLVNIVNAGGAAFSRVETVTLLNDLCLFAPSWLADPRLTWTAIDDLSAGVTFRNGPHEVSATLHFNAAGELVNFKSADRGAVQGRGRVKLVPWSTPLRDYRDFGGQRSFSQGEAIWHYPQGDFTYGKFAVTGFTAK
jgi:hypothetical protein